MEPSQAEVQYWHVQISVRFLLGSAVITSSGLVIVCIASYRKLNHNHSFWFIANLAAGDFLCGCGHTFAVLLELYARMTSQQPYISDGLPCLALCLIFSLSSVFNQLSLLGVTLERYITITKPMSYYYFINDNNCALAIAAISICSFFVSGAIFLPGMRAEGMGRLLAGLAAGRAGQVQSAGHENQPNMTTLPNNATSDETFWKNDRENSTWLHEDNNATVDRCVATKIVTKEYIFIFDSSLLAISLITLTLYFHLFYIAQSHLKHMRKEQGFFRMTALNKNLKAAKFTVKIFLITAIFQWPSRITNLVSGEMEELRGRAAQSFFHAMTLLVSICNPFIFAYFNDDFRNALKNVFSHSNQIDAQVPVNQTEADTQGSSYTISDRLALRLESQPVHSILHEEEDEHNKQ